MEMDKIIELISRGRTDYIFQLIRKPNWKELLHQGDVKLLQWLVYYNDTTALRAVIEHEEIWKVLTSMGSWVMPLFSDIGKYVIF